MAFVPGVYGNVRYVQYLLSDGKLYRLISYATIMFIWHQVLVVLHPCGFQFTVVLFKLPKGTSLCNGCTCVSPVIQENKHRIRIIPDFSVGKVSHCH